MTKSELIEKYALEMDLLCTVDSGADTQEQIIDDGESTEFITRLLEAYDAQRGVGGWHKECGDTIANFVNDNSKAGKPTYSAEIAALIAQHAPKGVDVEDLWNELYRVSMEKLATNCAGGGILISKLDLAAALAAQGEK